jgi:hypothetical protein
VSVKDWPWLAWLGLFLLVEVPAAIRKTGGTLSAFVWRVFALKPSERRFGPARRITFAVFWIVAGLHFVVQLPWGWVVGSGAPFLAVIVYAVGWEPDLGLIDKAARTLALRWLKGKANSARERGSEAMKLVDGWKTWISAVIWIGVAFWALVSGQDLGPIARGIAEALRWETPTGENVILYGMIANTLFAIWGVTAKLLKARQQSKAGATVGELMGPIGYLKAASVDGTLTSDTLLPVRLNMTDSPPVAPHVKSDGEKGNPVVASVVVAPTPVAPAR